ncbi:helix-turn-helix transcriptional regulator [Streptomyces sp. NPDC048191]|uniref:helix-turn-helix domain-containing protein n=1 Tax=Streptomyces sp. NPDC048191 TaxID=3155484 RepID=UPI00340CBDB0
MTATTSPSNWASQSAPHETAVTGTGPDGSRADSPSSSTPDSHCRLADEDVARVEAALASALRDLRIKHGWSVYDLEARTGVSRSTLSRIERQVTSPTVAVLAKVCRAYGCSVSHLLAEAEGDPACTAVPNAQSAPL